MPAAEVKRLIPHVAIVARDLYGVDFKKGIAPCLFPENHNHRDRDPSLRHDKKKDRLFCASQKCFGEKGVDAIGLVQRVDRCSFTDAIQKLKDQYGIQNGNDTPHSQARSGSPVSGASRHSRLIPAESVRRGLSRRGFRAVAEFAFGARLRKVRFQHESARQTDKERAGKEFRWEHLVDGIWFSGDGGLSKPLYVNLAFRERDQVGLVVGFEGEAKADLAGEFGIAAFSFKNITPEQALTLVDCEVVLWPDNDASGAAQADAAARITHESGNARTVKIVTPPAELPPAGDIVDAIKDLGWDRPRIEQIISTATVFTPEDALGREGGKKAKLPATGNFHVSDEGVFFLKEREDESREPIVLAARVDVVAETRDAGGSNWGRLLRWRDNEERQHQWAMPMELLASDAGAVRARLLGEGLPFIATSPPPGAIHGVFAEGSGGCPSVVCTAHRLARQRFRAAGCRIRIERWRRHPLSTPERFRPSMERPRDRGGVA